MHAHSNPITQALPSTLILSLHFTNNVAMNKHNMWFYVANWKTSFCVATQTQRRQIGCFRNFQVPFIVETFENPLRKRHTWDTITCTLYIYSLPFSACLSFFFLRLLGFSGSGSAGRSSSIVGVVRKGRGLSRPGVSARSFFFFSRSSFTLSSWRCLSFDLLWNTKGWMMILLGFRSVKSFG